MSAEDRGGSGADDGVRLTQETSYWLFCTVMYALADDATPPTVIISG